MTTSLFDAGGRAAALSRFVDSLDSDDATVPSKPLGPIKQGCEFPDLAGNYGCAGCCRCWVHTVVDSTRTVMRVMTATAALASTTLFVVATTTAGDFIGRCGIGLASPLGIEPGSR
jgi:hypothetical protein